MTDTLLIRLPGAQMLTTRILCMKCCDLHTEIPRHQESYIKPWMPFFIGFEESVWKRVGGGKHDEDIYVSVHVDDCLIACKSKDIMTAFKKEILTRFICADEGEVTEYLVGLSH